MKIKIPTEEDLECLITWPAGSVGENEERVLIAELLVMCKEHGFGRVPQLARAIEEIWNDSEKIEEYQKIKEDHFKRMGWAKEGM